MDTLLSILYYFFIGFGALVFIGFIVLLVFAVRIHRSVETLTFSLPWMVWMTLGEIAAKVGYGRFKTSVALSVMHKMKRLEVRALDELSPEELEEITLHGYAFQTTHLYEVRLTRRGGKKKRKPWFSVREWWQPAHA